MATKYFRKSVFLAWRHRMGLDRKAAAEKLGISFETVTSIELGRRRFNRRLYALCQVLEADAKPGFVSVPGAAIRIVGGGTVMHVRNHLALCAPAYGTTAKALAAICAAQGREVEVTLSRMADPRSLYETNHDMAELAQEIVEDSGVRVVFWNPAICDFSGQIGDIESGRKAERLLTQRGGERMELLPTDKILSSFRSVRKDLYLVAFKTTTNASRQLMYERGLALLKGNSCNLVLVNDTVTGLNMVVVPEEASYAVTTDRTEALSALVRIAMARASNSFTRSEVVPGPGVSWRSGDIPENLRQVVEHCISAGVYRPFAGKTVGHFAVKTADGGIITSRRHSNFNDLDKTGMVRIETRDSAKVVAYGGKPSVGGQSQRIVFAEHPEMANIVHFHAPLRVDAPDGVPTVEQWPFECGSLECGSSTSQNLKAFGVLKAVMLEEHGPNIVFGRDVAATEVIEFIERNFDLAEKTGGLFSRDVS